MQSRNLFFPIWSFLLLGAVFSISRAWAATATAKTTPRPQPFVGPLIAGPTPAAKRARTHIELVWCSLIDVGSYQRALSWLQPETFKLFVCCVCSGGTGKPAAAYKGRTESCPSGFFYGSESAHSSMESAAVGTLFTVGSYPTDVIIICRRLPMELILIVIVLILLFGGGGYWGRRRGHW
jgi:hypothetical protein